MRAKRNPRSKLSRLALGCALAVLSPPASSDTTPIPAALPTYDFLALLTATDEVDYCAELSGSVYAKRLGADVIPTPITRSWCQCMSDLQSRVATEFIPDQPSLQNAILQVGMNNRDLAAILISPEKHPGGIDAFLDFMDTDGKLILGFDLEQFNDATTKIGDFTTSKPETMKAMAAELPSCKTASELSVKQFPELEAGYSLERWDEMIAARELERALQACRTNWHAWLDPKSWRI